MLDSSLPWVPSSISSKVVALVECDPCDEPLLCGGEGRFRRPSELWANLPLGTDLLFPASLSEVGALPPLKGDDVVTRGS